MFYGEAFFIERYHGYLFYVALRSPRLAQDQAVYAGDGKMTQRSADVCYHGFLLLAIHFCHDRICLSIQGPKKDRCSGELRPGAALEVQKNTKIFIKLAAFLIVTLSCECHVSYIFISMLVVLQIQRLHMHCYHQPLSASLLVPLGAAAA